MSKNDEQDANIKLVKAIERHPCLYNFKLPVYSRKEVTDAAWTKIAEEMKETPQTCQGKWKNLRTVFVRKLKVAAINRKKSINPYYLSESMRFILPFVKPHTARIAGSVGWPVVFPQEFGEEQDCQNEYPEVKEEDTDRKDFELDDVNETKPVVYFNETSERDNNELENLYVEVPHTHRTNNIDEDPRKMFILSLLPEIGAMTEVQMRKFKRQVLSLIDNILSEPRL